MGSGSMVGWRGGNKAKHQSETPLTPGTTPASFRPLGMPRIDH